MIVAMYMVMVQHQHAAAWFVWLRCVVVGSPVVVVDSPLSTNTTITITITITILLL